MNYVYIAASIDGYIATVDGGVDWLDQYPNPENSDYGSLDFIRNIDAVVMGRHTFEKVLTFGDWPYDKKVFVLSRGLTTVPDALKGRVELMSGSPEAVVESINQAGFRDLYIDGGIVIQDFLKHDLIDELIVTRIPVLLGNGIPLFGTLNAPLRFEHKETTVYNNAFVTSRFARIR